MANGDASSEERVLLVEGQDDEHVVRHLRRSDSQMPTFCIRTKGGVDDLLRGVRGEILAEERTAVGILVDANDDWEARWQAVTDRIRMANMEPPSSPDPGGTIIEGSPRVGIWLMPDNESPGELEDFVAKMIPCDDAVWPLSQSLHRQHPGGAPQVQPGQDSEGQGPCLACDERGASANGISYKRGRLETRCRSQQEVCELA